MSKEASVQYRQQLTAVDFFFFIIVLFYLQDNLDGGRGQQPHVKTPSMPKLIACSLLLANKIKIKKRICLLI
jgi:hypothetical protein